MDFRRGINSALVGRDVPSIFHGTRGLEAQQAYIVKYILHQVNRSRASVSVSFVLY
jgi:hypothetical protein